MPIANGFLSADRFSDEYFSELKVGFCQNCNMVQLTEQPDREMMFHQDYAFFSSTSTRMGIHFKQFAEAVNEDYLKSSDPFVVELGSNDGIFLAFPYLLNCSTPAPVSTPSAPHPAISIFNVIGNKLAIA